MNRRHVLRSIGAASIAAAGAGTAAATNATTDAGGTAPNIPSCVICYDESCPDGCNCYRVYCD